MLSPTPVAPPDWLAAATALRPDHPVFDWLGAVDDVGRTGGLRVIVQLLSEDHTRTAALATELAREDAVLASLRGLWPGAGWAEREAAEAFGITFTGGDPRPLFLRGNAPIHPLRKDVVVAARVAHPWPGAGEPGGLAGSRRTAPPGVPDPAVWGDRTMDDPADPAAVAESLTSGGRRRRR